MIDIVAFLEAQLLEDEASANACIVQAGDANWSEHVQCGRDLYGRPKILGIAVGGDLIDFLPPSRGRDFGPHVIRHDPARILREVAAKRLILADHTDDEGQCARCLDSDGITYLGAYTAPWPCPAVRALAAVYSDHPDYQSDW